MLFSSLIFLFVFLPLTLLIYFISDDKYKNYILLFFSLVFYSWGEPKYIFLMLASLLFNYIFALIIDKYNKNKTISKTVLVISIIFNLSLIFVFKYFDFFVSNINNIFGIKIPLKNIALPIGISFYTFQIMSYVVDVYKKDVKVQKNIFLLGTYLTFFPQLIAGPIVRYSTVEEELRTRHHSISLFADGFRRFIVGLGKKVIIANNVALLADTILNGAVSNHHQGIILIIGVLSYTLQIYYDFSGYSDMAIGLGKMFGFHFLENFDYPYISCSITEFWRRWHISLSTWFRDYIYIPLGGNRVSKPRWIFNIFVVWMLTGLWHGASWNFVIWGLYFGIILLIEKLFLSKFLDKLPKIVRWIYSFVLINLGWIIFRMEDISSMKYLLLNIFNNLTKPIGGVLAKNYFLLNYIPYFIIGIILMFPIIPFIKNKFKDNKYFVIIDDVVLLIVFVISICLLINNTYNPFIYFRF